MLIPFGVLSAAGAGGVGFSSDYELIETIILTAQVNSVEFSSLGTYSSTYKHLQVRTVARSFAGGVAETDLLMRLNGDTGANYARHVLRGFSNSITSESQTSQTSMRVGNIAARSAAASEFSGAIIDILDAYSTTKNKTVKSLSGITPAYGTEMKLLSNLRISTHSTTSITLLPGQTPFEVGCRFSLYGLRG